MARLRFIQRCYDRIRRKGNRGKAAEDFDSPPLHYGSRYIYRGSEIQPVIRRFAESPAPCFIPRPGLTELRILCEFIDSMHKPVPVFSKRWRRNISMQAGFFTPTDEMLTRFCCELLALFADADVFGTFGVVRGEQTICERYLSPDAVICHGGAGAPVDEENPWTEALRGKKVLVVSPFAGTIEKQYRKRELLFSNPKTLPEFRLSTIAAVQSQAYEPCGFSDWFAALDHMKGQIDRADFDIALISAGAYAMHLAHHCKTIGKKGFQMAGTGQLLFGIKGRRWVEHGEPDYMNGHWVFPAADERPAKAELVEDGCYW